MLLVSRQGKTRLTKWFTQVKVFPKHLTSVHFYLHSSLIDVWKGENSCDS